MGGALFGLLAGGKLAGMMGFAEQTGAALDSVTFLVFGRAAYRTGKDLGPGQKGPVAVTWRVWMASTGV